jgi:hypothetical protein
MNTLTPPILLAAAIVASFCTTVASAQGVYAARYEELFDTYRRTTLKNVKDNLRQASPPIRSDSSFAMQPPELRRRSNTAEPLPTGGPGSTTAVDLLSGALSTNLEGVVAGLSVSPIGLLNKDASPMVAALNIVVASLEEDRTRLGLKWSYEWSHVTSEKVKANATCLLHDMSDMERASFIDSTDAAFRQLRAPFVTVCERNIEPWTESDLPDAQTLARLETDATEAGVTRLRARAACGLPPDSPDARRLSLEPAPEFTLSQVTGRLKNALALLVTSRNEQVRQRAADARQAWDQLDTYAFPISTAMCTGADIKDAWLQAQWQSPRIRLGFSVMGDFYPTVSGFNPKAATEPLPDGRTQATALSVETSIERGRVALQTGLGVRRARETLTDQMYRSVAPSVAFSFMACRIGGGNLTAKKESLEQLVLTVGEVPPHVVVGLSLAADLALTRPESQATRWNSFDALAFVDFRISKTLSFRLGVPYTGKTVVRPATETVPERRDLQRSIPVSIATVIKM